MPTPDEALTFILVAFNIAMGFVAFFYANDDDTPTENSVMAAAMVLGFALTACKVGGLI